MSHDTFFFIIVNRFSLVFDLCRKKTWASLVACSSILLVHSNGYLTYIFHGRLTRRKCACVEQLVWKRMNISWMESTSREYIYFSCGGEQCMYYILCMFMVDRLTKYNIIYRKTEVMNLLESAGFSRSNPYYVVQQGKVQCSCLC